MLKKTMQFILLIILLIAGEQNMRQYRNKFMYKSYRKLGIISAFCYIIAGVLLYIMALELWSD